MKKKKLKVQKVEVDKTKMNTTEIHNDLDKVLGMHVSRGTAFRQQIIDGQRKDLLEKYYIIKKGDVDDVR